MSLKGKGAGSLSERMAFLLLQQDLLTTYIRAHGQESWLGSAEEAHMNSSYKSKSIDAS